MYILYIFMKLNENYEPTKVEFKDTPKIHFRGIPWLATQAATSHHVLSKLCVFVSNCP